ncbi:rhodanese-like domain-containing protein [Leptolyngbya sp. FACHB-261]|uniref:rhodanese-like domain-containing protein n=1 Tax=Leptolyngbya sp. FACHB-261 TaxID=2692806 RepID=UPI00168457D8|nr:rhodanese-like domain-containing protein [Leptolyngbya sp. FACHB-261]MBD2105135.1 rhodanese-like domain-containing protein [Leptolyngbya sp. FACHB-261]
MATKITRQELKAKLDAGKALNLVEALPASYYQEKHLPGALNLPLNQIEALASTLLPDKSAEVIVYCADDVCQNSSTAAKRLEALGYTNVRDYHEGKQDWVKAGLSTESGGVPAPATLPATL